MGLAGLLVGFLWLAEPTRAEAEDTAGGGETAEPGPHRNRLADTHSPYLLLHASDPVDWYPWGEEAFARSRRENKPIFLSIGYSTCYWCHVAHRTLYKNPDIAADMNRWFVNVKVDSEQRPELDRIYMLARELLTGQGGWPNNLFLTPDLKPFFALGYAPPEEDALGRAAFPKILRMISTVWAEEPDKAVKVADAVLDVMRLTEQGLAEGEAAAVDPAGWLARASAGLLAQFDAENGGFVSEMNPTKFPMPPVLGVLLLRSRGGDAEALDALSATLDAMALGGIYDQIGGGFHRYSTEPTWSLPHFEKMLYDNAQLLELYARAYRATARPLYRRVAGELAAYLSGQMMAPEGGFYTAQDAQIDGEEGANYLWTEREIIEILGEGESRRFFDVYALTPMPIQLPGGYVLMPGAAADDDPSRGDVPGVLRVRRPIAETLRRAGFTRDVAMLTALGVSRQQLLRARRKRPQPLRDEKLIVGLNGLAITAFAESGQVFGAPRHVAVAARAAERIWKLAYDEANRRLKHEIFGGVARTDGFLGDYALLGRGLMSLHDATGEAVWRERAASLAGAILDRFVRADGGLRMSEAEADLLIPPEDTGDGVYPSGTSATIELFLRLAAATGRDIHAAAARRLLGHYSGRIERQPDYWVVAIVAANRHGAVASLAGAERQEQTPAPAYRVPTTADHVRVAATLGAAGDQERIAVTINIDAGFHINANPASLEGLIPTTVTFDDYVATRVVYPPPGHFQPRFVPDGLAVYEDQVVLEALFPGGTFAGAGPIRATVTAQACNDVTCLAPADLSVTVARPE